MRLILNLLWFVLSGVWLAIGYAIAGVIACVFIITIPFGLASFRIAGYVIWPFGRTVVDKVGAYQSAAGVGNLIWLIFAGWWLALLHLLAGALLCITIVGIPLGVANFKMVGIALLPFGKEVVSVEEAKRRGAVIDAALAEG